MLFRSDIQPPAGPAKPAPSGIDRTAKHYIGGKQARPDSGYSRPVASAKGMLLAEVGDGSAVFEGTPGEAHLNPMGSVHGGWYGTVLDSAMACAVTTRVPKGCIATTLEYKLNIIRPIPVGMMVEAIGETDHVGRSTGVAQGKIVGVENGRLYATASTTCMVIKLEPPKSS